MMHRLMYMGAGVFTVIGAYGVVSAKGGAGFLFAGMVWFLMAYLNEQDHRKK